jgi:hypothetical protein
MMQIIRFLILIFNFFFLFFLLAELRCLLLLSLLVYESLLQEVALVCVIDIPFGNP